MVGKINPNNSSNNNIPPDSGDLSFKHDYTSPQQRVMNEHINELKNLLKTGDINDPEVKQQIAQLRHQIQYKDLPAVGLSERRRPTVSDAMQYIDQQSGYTAHVENAAKAVQEVSVSKQSKKSSWRSLAGAAQGSSKAGKAGAPVKTRLGKAGANDDLATIQQNIQTWQTQNPGKLTSQINQISSAIDQFRKNPQLTADSLRSWLQLAPDPSGIKTLFNTSVYQQLSSDPKTAQQMLGSLFKALGLDSNMLPETSAPSVPKFKPGFVAYVFKNLPDQIGTPPSPTTINIGGHVNGGGPPMYVTKINPDGSFQYSANQGDGAIPKTSLPTFTDSDGKQQSYVYLPANLVSGRIYYNWHGNTGGDYPAFTEFNMDPNGNPDVNFTAVDNMPKLTSSVQLVANNEITNRNGVQSDQATLYAKMSQLYKQYDPSGTWQKNMYTSDGSIRSGKHMGLDGGDLTDPTITNTLSDYLNKTFMPQMAQKKLYFMADGLPGQPAKMRSGTISHTPDGKGWQFNIDGASSPMVLPYSDPAHPNPQFMNQWVSGAFGGGTGSDDPLTGAAKWGAVKALSSIINKGMLPSDVNTSADKPMGAPNGQLSFFTDPSNVKNFYKATDSQGNPAYNIYLRAMHEAGCSAYGADFDDYMGGDGSVGDDHTFQPAVIINFGASSPTPPVPPTPTQFMLAQQYMDNLNDWLQAHNDTNPNSGIEKFLAIPLGNAINSGKLNNYADIQNWLKTSTDGKNAMKYLTNQLLGSNIYKTDPALAALSPSAAQGELQKLFNSLLMPVQAPTPPGPPRPPSFDPSAAVDKLWSYTQYGSQPVNIPQVYMQHAAGFQTQMAAYTAEVNKYNNMNPQQQAAERPTLVNMYNVTFQGYNNSSGYDLLYGDGPGIVSDEACRILGLPLPMTQDQATAMGKVMDSRYLGPAPILPPPPGPPGPTPAQSTAAIYGDKKMTPSFHDQFMALPIMKEIGQYQADLAAYNQNPTQSGYTALMAEFNKVQGDVSGGLTPSVLQLLQKNSAEIQSLGINPSQFSDIAKYITGTQEKGNIPAIAPPNPPGPPPTQTIEQYKQALLAWLGAPGHDANQYLRNKYVNQIFGMIDRRDGQQIKTVADMLNWLNNGPGKAVMAGLTSQQIYSDDPGLTQSTLQDLFKTLGLTAPVPTPPGPPPTDDVQWLFQHYPNTIKPLYDNDVVQMTRQIKVGSPADIASLMAAHFNQYKAMLQGHPLPPGTTINQLATELCNKEWTDAGGKGPAPIPPS